MWSVKYNDKEINKLMLRLYINNNRKSHAYLDKLDYYLMRVELEWSIVTFSSKA